MNLRRSLFGMIAFVVSPLIGQVSELAFERLAIEDGLSQSVVTAIVQDHQGFMWFGTQDGLNRYDGLRFKVFKQRADDASSLSNNYIQSLFVDQRGRLWVGTLSAGLNLYLPDREGFRRIALLDNASVTVLCIGQDARGDVWVGTMDHGLFQLSSRDASLVHQHVASDPSSEIGLHADTVWALLLDTRDHLWIGTNRGINLMSPEKPHISLAGLSDSIQQVNAMFEDGQGRIWIATHGQGLFRTQPDSETWDRYVHRSGDATSLSADRVMDLSAAQDGGLWIATWNGLCRWHPETESFSTSRHQPTNMRSLAHDQTLAVCSDRAGVLWVGTTGGGLCKLSPVAEAFRHYRHSPIVASSISSSIVFCVLEDRRRQLWIGTYDAGLNRIDLDTGTIDRFRHDPADSSSISDDQINALFEDAHGALWVGCNRGGLNRFDRTGRAFTRFSSIPGDPTSPSGQQVTAICEDAQGRLWVGAIDGGISLRLDLPNTFQRLRHDAHNAESLASDAVTSLCPDASGGMWVGTSDHGLDFFDGHVFRHVPHDPDHPDSLAHDTVNCILIASSGPILLGTDGGLSVLRRSSQAVSVQNFGEPEGLPNEIVYGIVEDRNGFFWMSTNQGLAKFDLREKTFVTYDASHGLLSNEFNQGAYNQNARGIMYFGGIAGLTAFDPSKISRNAVPPLVALTGFKILNRAVDFDRPVYDVNRIELEHQDSVVSFEYVALDFTNPTRNQYAHRLVGFDEDWVFTGNKHDVTYTNLAPGAYRFQVKAANDNDTWSSTAIAVDVHVLPPWWATWWARTIYAFLFLLTFAGIPLLRIRQLKHRELRLADMVREKTAELRRKNDELESMNRDLVQTTTRLKQTQQELIEAAHFAGMAEIATSVLHNVGNTLNSLNVSADVIHRSLARAREVNMLKDVVDLVLSHQEDLADFLMHDPRGQKIPKLLNLLNQKLQENMEFLKSELERLKTNIDRVHEIVSAQQEFARCEFTREETDLNLLLQDLIETQRHDLSQADITVTTAFASIPAFATQKFKLINILLNLIRNAIKALESRSEDRRLWIATQVCDGQIRVAVKDNGEGIAATQLTRIFQSGYTTWQGGRGLGLHYCGNAAGELGGRIEVRSSGPGHGAEFVLWIPLQK